MDYVNEIEFARKLDQDDPLNSYRTRFHIPKKEGKDLIYFCGNSLGLKPKSSTDFVQRELRKWGDIAVEGHFTEPKQWVAYHHFGRSELGKLVGARDNEVVAMNNLTTNLHLMLASFYQPKERRNKVIIESGAFPSDHFAVTSHMKMKGVDPNDALIELKTQDDYLATEIIIQTINKTGNELSLVLLPGVQYYTGQFFDMPAITNAAHSVGAYVGFDLAHAIGNIPMNLHEIEADFAVWCSYKYLNSGPGNVGGAFIHEKHNIDTSYPRLGGWWGQQEHIRFKMETNFQPMKGIDGWMLSNVNVISSAAHLASLEIFKEAGIKNLRSKSIDLTGYLEFLLTNSPRISSNLKILTPSKPEERGCQLSLYLKSKGKDMYNFLSQKGVVTDWREPNVIRVAPTPLYNTFEEVFAFVKYCERAYEQIG